MTTWHIESICEDGSYRGFSETELGLGYFLSLFKDQKPRDTQLWVLANGSPVAYIGPTGKWRYLLRGWNHRFDLFERSSVLDHCHHKAHENLCMLRMWQLLAEEGVGGEHASLIVNDYSENVFSHWISFRDSEPRTSYVTITPAGILGAVHLPKGEHNADRVKESQGEDR